MEYRPLERTGVQVSPLCLRAMMFGPWGYNDTADVPSPDTDVDETLGAPTDLVGQGKVRYIVSSSHSGSQIVEAQQASRECHLERFVTEQPPYSILFRGTEDDILPTVQRHGMCTLTYSPLSGNQRKLDIVEELAQLAEQNALSISELAFAFAINHPGVSAAIVGPRTIEQLESCLPAADVKLSTDVMDRIDQLVAPGVTVNPDDNSHGTHALTPVARRRTQL